MMPAMRAVAITSPFLALPERMRSSVSRAMTTAPLAVAERAVTALSPTSTMSARPSAARCVRRAVHSAASAFSRASSARVAAATSACRIRLSPTRIARTPASRSRVTSAGVRDAALADEQPVGRHQRRQTLGHSERRLEGLQIAVVDADERRGEVQRPLELRLVMHLEEHVHAERQRHLFERLCLGVRHRRHDDEDAVGAPGARLEHLVGLEHEIFSERRKGGRRTRCGQEFRRALERRRVGQHREAGRAARLVGPRQRRRIEIGADQALRRARLLDLRDQRDAFRRDLPPECLGKSARRLGRRRSSPSAPRAARRLSRRRSPAACRSRSASGCQPRLTRSKRRRARRAPSAPRRNRSTARASFAPLRR